MFNIYTVKVKSLNLNLSRSSFCPVTVERGDKILNILFKSKLQFKIIKKEKKICYISITIWKLSTSDILKY